LRPGTRGQSARLRAPLTIPGCDRAPIPHCNTGPSVIQEPEFDASILEGCRQGDPEAQRRVFERYKDRVFSIALHFLKGDDAAAQDVTQEVFVKVFRAAPSFRQDARLSTWLYRIVANACMDELRRRRRLVLYGDVPSRIHPAVAPSEPVELDADVSAALGRLSPKVRIAVLLRYFDDLTYDEIADALGVTHGTVASRLNRAHKFLARELAHLNPARAPS
jgi:RNA polymerase sigma-70 factor (ECF subfamily)